jgi:hypothetical protein
MNEPCKKCGEYHNNCFELAELTDEEITEEWAKFYPDVFHTHLIDFARAILKKASEK